MDAAASKVIIVGGGPVGMTAAHALTKAGIDFVVLESRPEIVMDAGSGLVLSAMGLRALAQLGLLSALNESSTPVDKFARLDHKGKDIGDTMFFTYFKERSVVP
jgi:2-polyprenyl-6-methoxyphenol hydroxylase-like FAD-dependent oxidoreductase